MSNTFKIQALVTFLNLQKLWDTNSEEIECLKPSASSDFYIVGTQVDAASRLIGAVVNNSDTGSVFFALGLTTESNVCLKTFSDSFNTLRAQHHTDRDLFSDIDPTFLNAKSERTGLSAAQMLCINVPGRNLLLQVNGLAAKIEPAALNEKLPASAGDFADMSAAQILFLNPDGRELLLQDKSLAAKIEPAALNEKLPATPWGFADMSAAQVLFLYGDGLKLLLQVNGLAAKIEAAALNEKFPASARGFADMSAMQVLFLTRDGPELLLQDNGLAAKIEAAALNEKLTASALACAGMSAAQILFLAPDGPELLLQPNGLAAKIEAAALNEKLPASAGDFVNMSAAQVLGRTQAGVAIVTKIALDCAAQVQKLAFTASLKRPATPEQPNERLGALLMAASLFKSDGKRRCLNSTLPSQQHPAP